MYAEYNLINKIFTVKIGHTFENDKHNYIKEIDKMDLSVLKYMKNYNMVELQMKKC